MQSGGQDHHPRRPFQLKQDDKFFSRLVSRESSMANSSGRVYFGVTPAAVPFTWESQPGTPKHRASTTPLPPLTPPPSYLYNSQKLHPKRSAKSKAFNAMLPRLILRKTPKPTSPSSSSRSPSSPSYSSSLLSSPAPLSSIPRRRLVSSPRTSFDSGTDDEYHPIGSPTSTLCFGVSHSAAGGLRGCCLMVGMKNALLSVVSNGSSQGAIRS